jgi:hypothetical protein
VSTQITETLIQPPAALLTPVTDPDTGQTNYAFPLQTRAWLKMQTMVTMALGVPLSTTNFQDLYGTFTDEGTVETAVTILSAINSTAAKYGDPQTLITSLPQFQQSGTAPSSIYGNAVWLAAQTQLAAQQIASLLSQGLTDIGQNPDPATRVQELTELLTGQGGINSYATTLQDHITSFETAVTAFYNELNPELTGPDNSLSWYLSQSGNVLDDAKTDLQNDTTLIDGLNQRIKELNDQYVSYTLAAETAPLYLLIPLWGPVLAVADAATFGKLASQVKDELNNVRDHLESATEDKKKKGSLVAVLGHFNLAATDVETDGQEFLDAISGLISGWNEFSSQIGLRLGALTPDDVANWGAFMTKLGFQTALDGWDLIAAKAESFFQTGFVQFSTQKSI